MQKGGVIDSLRLFDCAGVSTNRRGAAQTLTSAAGKAIRIQGVVQRVRNAARIGAEQKIVFVFDHDGRSLDRVERLALEVSIRRGDVPALAKFTAYVYKSTPKTHGVRST